jgi:hypothetical protein
MDPYQWQQIASDHRADDADNDVSNQSKATASDQLAGFSVINDPTSAVLGTTFLSRYAPS